MWPTTNSARELQVLLATKHPRQGTLSPQSGSDFGLSTFSYSGPLFTKKTPSYGYRNPHYKPKTVWRPSQVYNGNPYTDKTASSLWIEAQGSSTGTICRPKVIQHRLCCPWKNWPDWAQVTVQSQILWMCHCWSILLWRTGARSFRSRWRSCQRLPKKEWFWQWQLWPI